MSNPRLYISLPDMCVPDASLFGDFDSLLTEWAALLDPVDAALSESRHWTASAWDRVGLVSVSSAATVLVREAARRSDATQPDMSVWLGLAILASVREKAGERGHDAAFALEGRGWLDNGAGAS